MKDKKVLIVITSALVFIGLGSVIFLSHGNKPRGKNTAPSNKSSLPSSDRPYITANPIDLNQIESISKFRSCAGHDSSGHNFAGEAEADRSMKHYAKPLPAFYDDKAALYAPFDGTVAAIDGPHPEQGPGKARGGQLDLATSVDPNVLFTFGHIIPVEHLFVDEKVQAGQLVGYATTAGGSGGNDFDLVLRAINQPPPINNYDTSDSIFTHMTPTLLAEYMAVGITPDTIIVPKAERDAAPCLFGSVAAEPSDRTGPPPAIQTSPDNWIVLQR